MFDTLLSLDGNILLFIQNFLRNPLMTPIMKVVTTLGNNGAIWILFTVLLLAIPRIRKVGAMMTAALLGTLLINNIILKNLVARIRPYEVLFGAASGIAISYAAEAAVGKLWKEPSEG